MLPAGTPVQVRHASHHGGFGRVIPPHDEWSREQDHSWVRLHNGLVLWYCDHSLDHGPEIIAAYTAYLMGVPCSP